MFSRSVIHDGTTDWKSPTAPHDSATASELSQNVSRMAAGTCGIWKNRFGRVMSPIRGSSSNTISAGMNATRTIRYGNRRGCGRYWAIAPDTSGPSAPPNAPVTVDTSAARR